MAFAVVQVLAGMVPHGGFAVLHDDIGWLGYD
jgi:hypothetical protein